MSLSVAKMSLLDSCCSYFHPQIASHVAGPAQLPLGGHSFLGTRGALLGTIPPGTCRWDYIELL